MQLNRRKLLYGVAASAAAAGFPAQMRAQVKKVASSCPFHLSVINDEISPDLDHAAHIAANEFGLQYIELRNINGKGLHNMSPDELNEAKKILAKYPAQGHGHWQPSVQERSARCAAVQREPEAQESVCA